MFFKLKPIKFTFLPAEITKWSKNLYLLCYRVTDSVSKAFEHYLKLTLFKILLDFDLKIQTVLYFLF
jgi:hypothetical protein